MKISLPSIPNLVKGSILNSPTRLIKLARSTGWLKREPKKLEPITLIRGILHAVGRGEASFRLLSQSIGLHLDGKIEVSCDCDVDREGAERDQPFGTISKPALWERINNDAVEFFRGVLFELMKGGTKPAPADSRELLPGITAILGEDSSLINLHKSLADRFPATRNQNVARGAGLRLQAVFDLLSGRAIHLQLTEYLRNDQSAAYDIIPLLKPGDLILRDLGYLVTGALGQIVGTGAHFVSRLHSNWLVYRTSDDGGNEIDIVRYLQTHAPDEGDTVDIGVGLGPEVEGSKRFECRLVARKVPARVEEKRLRKIARDEKRLGKQRSKKHKKFQGWEIYIASLDGDCAGVAKICEVYRLRWRIETIFKAFKSYTSLMKIARHHTNGNHIQVLLYGWLCLVVVASETGAFALAKEAGPDRRLKPNCLSLLKVLPKVFELINATLMVSTTRNMRLLFERWIAQIEYHDRYEKRKLRTNMAEMLASVLDFPDCEPPRLMEFSGNQRTLT